MAGIHFLDAKGPDGIRVYAVGDVHGRRDLIEAMHDRIGEEIARDGVADWRIVHLGDYVDRGPDTAGVLDFLTSRIAGEPRIVALAGNHDVALVDFLAHGDRTQMFRRFGGNDTARSYGTHVDFATAATAEAGRQALARAMPQAHLDFLSGLPRAVAFGDFFFCHAGIRPGVPLERQDPEDLIWIREPFLGHPGLHPKVIVHGHTPHDEAELMPNRVDLDTLAYASGRLTALAVDGRTKRLLEVSG
ncbi:MAG: serine/threonine protein phosphatase [Rhizobiales bacterium]|jgi:serine/threonine protein phosphatase 1|nr:serine/threonine protein phosphatase [Hyphomicrobiales bacterium]OJU34161.1 MAG: serine/threonine protein phosphatase [Rhizobiales bacterium 68-8]